MAVHRYKAGDPEPKEVAIAAEGAAKKSTKKPSKAASTSKAAKPVKKETEKTKRKPNKFTAPFRAFGRYFKGSWHELRQVRWPNRKQTWVLTLAVIVFSLLLGGLIFVLDLGFTFLFKEVLL